MSETYIGTVDGIREEMLPADGDGRLLSDEDHYTVLRKGGEQAECAFSELYDRHSRRIYAYCRTFFQDVEQVEDMFQETFTRFFESAQKGVPIQSVRAYLTVIARNQCLNALRNKRATVAFEDYHSAAHDAGPEKREMLRLVETALDLLPEDQREAFFLHEYEELSYPEIAGLIGVSQTAVRIRVHRARKQIRSILKPYLSE